MTREEAIHIYENSRLTSEYFTKEGLTAAYVAGLAALRAQQEAEKNEPLTLDELREMGGEPVWVMCLYNKNRSGWCLVDSDGDVYNDCYSFYDDSYGEAWLAYRRKQEEDTNAD